MKKRSLIHTALITSAAVCLLTASASASVITYNTNAAGTDFAGDGLTLNSTGGVAATLTFVPDGNQISGVPSNSNFGIFNLVCASCTTQALGTGSVFSAFTFDLIVTDVTDHATGEFVGTSTGGAVYSDVSQVTINWLPLQLGQGTLNALTGNFGLTSFNITNTTRIVSPNSGSTPGQTTVQGSLASAPEPATFGLLGVALLGLGAIGRKKLVKS
jgi:hypothetical protein